jgi:hypothetical protein
MQPACAEGPSAQPAGAEARRSVAVISVLGTRILGVTRGLTRLNDDHDAVDADWGLDALMVDQVAAALARQFEMRQVSFDHAAVLQASVKKTVFSISEPLVDELRRQVPAGSADLLIVVRLTEVADPFSGMPKVGIGGYGVTAINSPIFGRSVGRAFLICSMLVVDGARMEKLREQVCAKEGGFTDPKVPFRKLDEPMTKARLPNYTPEQQSWLREALQAMVVETVPLTLVKLKLAEIDRHAAPESAAPREESTR